MDAELKAKWVEALRSGEYRQDIQELRDRDNGFCCLGVLCDVMGAVWRDGHAVLDGVQLDDVDESLLSKETLERVGLTNPQQTHLAHMNDDGSDFKSIADYIEVNL